MVKLYPIEMKGFLCFKSKLFQQKYKFVAIGSIREGQITYFHQIK